MNFNFTKIDPDCFNILPLRWNECPMATLSTIGFNFSALDAEVCNLGFSATNIWNPLYTEFVENSANWDSVYLTVQENSAKWQSSYMTVRTLSAGWMSPITIMYPYPVATSYFSSSTITSWAAANFPVFNGSCRNYLEGQIMRVFSLDYYTVSQSIPATCYSSGTYFWSAFYIEQGGDWTRVEDYGSFVSIYQMPVFNFPDQATFYFETAIYTWPTYANAGDRYTNRVRGIELKVVNGSWAYIKNLY